MRARLWIVLGAALALANGALAQDFPTKPIRLVVPFPPGGPNDIIARVVAKPVSEAIHQPVIVDNRSGAGGVVGTDVVAKAAPDGYTLGLSSAGALAISVSLQKMPYDPLKDLAPITLVVTVPEILVVHPGVPARNLAELVALAKGQPGKLNFASAGNGSMTQLAGEMLKFTANVDIVHVPYRGAAPAVTDLLAGQVQMMFADIPVLLPHVQSGALRAIAIGSKGRAPAVPDVPTTTEAGFAPVEANNWYGLVAPAGTPAPIIAKLHREFTAAMRLREVSDQLGPQGATLVGNSPAEFADFIRNETAKWAKIVQISGAKAD
ncbi:MAG: tripartite tricarboxylate transporter substrate binding protein [Proteobacteria bacterium]|nr:tripartite tricarboxylate transporter substrate binding protein [Pseudomonadota bacterium]